MLARLKGLKLTFCDESTVKKTNKLFETFEEKVFVYFLGYKIF